MSASCTGARRSGPSSSRPRSTSLRHAYRETVRSMAYVVEAKDAYTGQHLERCRVYGLALLEAIGVAADYPDAEFGFLLHDVGKVGVPERILNKPGPLTAAEWRVMRTHPTIGSQILAGIPGMENAAEIVRCHHEMWSRRRLPGRPGQRGDPAAGPGVPGRRRLRRHDHRPPLPRRRSASSAPSPSSAGGRHAVRSRRRRRVRRHRRRPARRRVSPLTRLPACSRTSFARAGCVPWRHDG